VPLFSKSELLCAKQYAGALGVLELHHVLILFLVPTRVFHLATVHRKSSKFLYWCVGILIKAGIAGQLLSYQHEPSLLPATGLPQHTTLLLFDE
jgi:hypothetical protein